VTVAAKPTRKRAKKAVKKTVKAKTPQAKQKPAYNQQVHTMVVERGRRGGFSISVGGENALGKGYGAATGDRTRRTRVYSVGGADQHQDVRTLDKLRETARDFDRNNSIIHGACDRICDNVVGPTFGFRAQTDSEAWNKEAHEWMVAKMGPDTDVRGLFDFHELLGQTMRAMCTDGDQFILFVKGGQTQIIETQQVATPSDKRGSGHNVVNGVEMDRAGRPKAIYIGKQSYDGFLRAHSTSDDVTRVTAENFLWPAYRTRATQTRGVPIIASAIETIELLVDYLLNEATAAAIDACLAFLIQGDIDLDNLPDDQYTQDGTDGTGASTTETLQQIQAGTIARIGHNEKVEMIGAKRPGTQFAPYLKASLRIIGSGFGLPLELLLLDFSDGNFSSQKAAILQAQRKFRIWQSWLVRKVATPMYRRWIGQAVAAGDLQPNSQMDRVRWFPPQWAHVQPEVAMKALKEGIALGATSVTSWIEDGGQTIEEFATERRKEIDIFKGNGTETPIPSTGMEGVASLGKIAVYALNEQRELPDLSASDGSDDSDGNTDGDGDE